MARPLTGDAMPYFEKYINFVQGNSIAEAMENHSTELNKFYNDLPESKADYAYAEGKWTIKEMLQHLMDAERIFTYRLLRISRADTTPLPGFEENEYAVAARANDRSLQSLKEEFTALRISTDLLLKSLTEEQLNRKGTTNNNPITANAIAFIMYGHLLHHQNILIERYGIKV